MTYKSKRCVWTNAAKHTTKLSVALALALAGSPAMSQPYSTTHAFSGVHSKQYSVELLDPPAGGQTTEAVMAGTAFTCSGSIGGVPPVCVGRVHFLQVDATTAPVASVVYDHPDYDDERAVDIVPAGNGEYFIICMVRPVPGGSAPFNNRDQIRVLRVDGSGTILSEATIQETTPLPAGATWGESLYPTHGLFISGPMGGLYICGYHTPGDTRTGTHSQPNYSDPKEAFVIKLDPTSLTPVAARYFNTLPTQLMTQQTKDYDIAMHMQLIMTGPQAGNLFVTGSVNALTGMFGGQYGFERSGTMCLVLQTNNLSDVFTPQKHFIGDGNQDGFGRDEYGLHLVEDPGTQANLIVGDYFNNGDSNPSALPGFNTTSRDVTISRLDNNFDRTALLDRGSVASSFLQPLAVMQSATTPPTNYSQFMVAGLTSSLAASSNCFYGSYNEYQPFLVDIEVQSDPSLNVLISPTNWYRYPTISGTAGYHNMGDGLSSAWLTTSAAKFGINDPILMTGPRLTNSGVMGLRTLTTASATNFTTDCSVTTCDPQYEQWDIVDPLVTSSNPGSSIWLEVETTSATNLLYHSAACSTENKQFTNIENIPLQLPVLAPNPATTEIKITGVEKGTYNIFDMAGKKLLSGTFSQGTVINIAKLPAATYTAEIIANDLSTKTKFIKQ